MPAKRGKKNYEKIKKGPKCSILGPQNLGSRGEARAPLDPRLEYTNTQTLGVRKVLRAVDRTMVFAANLPLIPVVQLL